MHKHCQKWVDQRGNHISASSFVQELDTLRLILDFAVSRGLLLKNPAHEIKRRKLILAKIVVPSREQFRTIIDAMRNRHNLVDTHGMGDAAADLVEFLAYSGACLGEAIAARWADVDLQSNAITFTGGETGTKNHEVRTLPMPVALRQFLVRLKQARSPAPEDRIARIDNAKKCLATTCRKLQTSLKPLKIEPGKAPIGFP